MNNTLVSTFMRANPPHRGHMIFIDKIKRIANDYNADTAVFLSHTTDKNNPIPYNTKAMMLQRWTNGLIKPFPEVEVNQPGNILHYANHHNYKNVIIVCGKDRFDKYRDFVEFGKSRPYFKFDSIQLVCHDRYDVTECGEVAEMTGTKMREFVRNNDWESFSHFLPFESHWNGRDAIELWGICRSALNIG